MMPRPPGHWLLLLLLVVASGCDTLEPEDQITLPPATLELSFRFSNTLQGISREIVSEDTYNLDRFLADNQYTRAEVISARVTSARIRLTTPFQETLDALSDIDVSLQANQAGIRTIATLAAPPVDKNAALSPAGGETATPFVQGGPFQGVLGFTGQRDVDEEFLLFVTLTLEVAVEGI